MSAELTNIEFKAIRRPGVPQDMEFLGPCVSTIDQRDTFYGCPSGLCKLRCEHYVEQDRDEMKLIWYNRAQVAGPKKSDIIIVNVSTVPELHALLATMLGVKNHVEKRRELYLIGRTRIHLDTLSDGRQFIEVEVVMRRREDPRSASKEAEEIKARLGIKDTDLIVGSYADMFTFTSTTTTTTH